MTDNGCDEFSLQATWRAMGHRIAVIGGCFVGLISLFNHVPVSTAVLRAAAAWFAVQVLAWLSGLALDLALRFDQAGSGDGQGEEV